MLQPTRVFDLIQILEEKFPAKTDILSYRTRSGWVYYSVSDYRRISTNIAYGLLARGYSKGDKIVVICSNRPEWNFIEMGAAMAGMIFISVYPTMSDDDFLYIFNHSDANLVIFGNRNLAGKIMPIAQKADHTIDFLSIDPVDGLQSVWDLEKEGENSREKFEKTISDNIANIDKDEIETILYTSGTTGTPKGVMLSHWNLMFNSHAHTLCMPIGSQHKMLSFLPLSHIYERSMNYDYQELGISIYYAESVNTMARDLAECHADGFCAVPRVLEKMYSQFENSGKDLKGFSKFIFNKAWKFGNRHDYYSSGWLYNLRHNLFDNLVYRRWREHLGGKRLTIVSGGSAIQINILRLFCAAGMTVHEGYGLSETSPVIAVNNPMIGINIFGTVGRPLKGTELKIAEDGEILTRGPHVMKGYYKDEALTREVIDSEGWFHTGDVGFLAEGRCLKITDRKKEIFKTTSGKYITPQLIEGKIRECTYFTNCMVIGSGQKYASAIIVADMVKIKELAMDMGIDCTEQDALLADERILKFLNSKIQEINRTLAAYEQIKRQRYVCDDWNTQNGMLSQSLKLKRNAICNRYAEIIKEIYR